MIGRLFNISFESEFPHENNRPSVHSNGKSLAFIGLQLISLAGLIYLLDLEPSSAFYLCFAAAVGYWMVSLWLPGKLLVPVALALSWFALYWIFGWFCAALLITIVCICIGIASLRINMWVRMFLILVFLTGMAIIRLEFFYMPRLQIVIPFAGAFLMFRLFFYMHDVHRFNTPTPVFLVLSYFFLLPNISFLLFPIVGYREYVTSLFNVKNTDIYHKSVQRIATGIFNLLLFRVGYHFVYVSPAFIQDGWDFIRFIVGSHLLYARLPGIFMLVIGTLGLFGYNLKEPFGKFFFAPSFAELWRRINVYWHDFVVTFFFNGLFLRFKKWGVSIQSSISLAILVAFIITAFLHMYQEVWVSGTPSLQWVRSVYWVVWGVLIVLGMKLSMDAPMKKMKDGKALTFFEAARHISNILIVFITMALLSSIWNLGSLAEWKYQASHLRGLKIQDWSWLIGGVSVFVLVTSWWVMWYSRRQRKIHFPYAARYYAVVALSVIALGTQHFYGDKMQWISKIASTKPLQQDEDQNEMGYYDDLIGSESANRKVWQTILNRKPANFLNRRDKLHIRTRNLLTRKMRPSVSVIVRGHRYTTNKYGFRDKEYPMVKDSGVTRYAFVGSSYLTGYGVDDNQCYEALLEEKLNARHQRKYECLNFGVGGYGIIQEVYTLEHEVLRWKPDTVFYMVSSREKNRATRNLLNLVRNGVDPEYPFLRKVVEKSGVNQYMSYQELFNRIYPYSESIIRWGYKRMATLAKNSGTHLVMYYLLLRAHGTESSADVRYIQKEVTAVGAGFIDLSAAYRGRKPLEVQVAANDYHPNKLGHQLLARTFYLEMMRNRTNFEK